jgi:phage terminase large subunit-like protein
VSPDTLANEMPAPTDTELKLLEQVFADAVEAEDDEDRARHAQAADGFETLDDFLRWANATRERSLAEELAHLPAEQQEEVLADVDPEAFLYSWEAWGRASQLVPDGDWSTYVIMAGRGWGKPLTESTPIVTPRGWTTMGALKPGDEVFDHAGQPTRVLVAYDPKIREVWRITFDDGHYVDAGPAHEWLVMDVKTRARYSAERGDDRERDPDWWRWASTPQRRGCPPLVNPAEEHIVRAKELRLDGATWAQVERTLALEFPDSRPSQRGRKLRDVLEGDGRSTQHSRRPSSSRTTQLRETRELRPTDAIPLALPLDFPEVELPVDPYVFGSWLGDGNTGGPSMGAGRDDWTYFDAEWRRRGYEPTTRQVRTEPRAYWMIRSARLREELKTLGLIGTSQNRHPVKHVPDIYLRGSIQQRLDLLRGMCDTDGTVDTLGISAGVAFVNKHLADVAAELATSLGFFVRRWTKPLPATEHRPARPFHIVNWRPRPDMSPFLLERKTARIAPLAGQDSRKTMRRIVSVERRPDEKLRCIKVDAPSQLFLAGRGLVPTHNSRVGSEWVRKQARENPGCRIILLGRTAADVRDVMVNGESGILACCPPAERPEHIPSRRALVWPNGSQALLASAVEPSLLRGPQAHFAWADEIGTYNHVPDDSGLTAWENLRIATRLGETPQVITTTTPRRIPAVEDLIAEVADASKGTRLVRGRTIDNVAALSRAYLSMLFHRYHGSALWAQEIMGELVEAAEGALWQDKLLNKARALAGVPPLPFRVLAVDPSVAEEPRDECGIVVVGGTAQPKPHQRHAYVLEDATIHGSPREWAKRVVETARKWQVAGVVAEGNQGGELVRMAINSIDPNLKVFIVHARQNKHLRAEPVVTAYEGLRVHHVGYLGTLEAQMTSWEPGVTKKSPDRVDALVYAVTAVLIDPPKGLFTTGRLRAKSAARNVLPIKKSGYTGHRTGRRAA